MSSNLNSVIYTPRLIQAICIYSRASMAQTLMAHSPGLARTIIMFPTGHFVHNPPWMARTSLG